MRCGAMQCDAMRCVITSRAAGSLYGGVGIGPLIRASKMSNSAEPSLMSYLQYSLSTPEYSSSTPGVHEPFLDVVRTVGPRQVGRGGPSRSRLQQARPIHSLGLRCARVAAKKALEQREAERPDIRRQTVRVAVQPKIAAARANQRTCWSISRLSLRV